MSYPYTHRKRRVRWDRIFVAVLLLALLVFGLIKGVQAVANAVQEPSEASSEESLSQSDSASQEAAESQNVSGTASESAAQPEEVSPSTDLSQWNLILVNSSNALPDDFTVATAALANGLEMDERAVQAMNEMIAAAKAENVELLVCSAYRTVQRQTQLFEAKMSEFTAQGLSDEAAYAKAATIVAPPGTSEHNTGLAADIVTPEYQVLDEGFAQTSAGLWLAKHAPDYGFILRYPQGKEEVTGIIYEPWHFRYVGVAYAQTITDSGLCLEEWLASQQA